MMMTSKTKKRYALIALTFIALVVVGLRAYDSYRKNAIPIFSEISTLSFVDQDAKEFNLDKMKGKVWIGCLFFTSCPGPCPLLSQKISTLQDVLPDVNFMSVSVDPETDTPSVLKEYAQRFHAKSGQWFLLNGDMSKVLTLARDSLKLNASEEVDLHSTRLVLIDSSSQVRGYYDIYDDHAMLSLVDDAKLLSRRL